MESERSVISSVNEAATKRDRIGNGELGKHTGKSKLTLDLKLVL